MTVTVDEPRRILPHLPVAGQPARVVRAGVEVPSERDVAALARELARVLEGEVSFDASGRGLYATDSSNFRQIPLGVVVPKTVEDVIATHRLCHRYGAPILNRGCGTSLSGETVNVAVVIDHSRYLRRIGEPDCDRRLVSVEPGAINQQVNEHTMKVGLVFGPDPSSHPYCTIGGNVGNNSCGIHSVLAAQYGPGPRTSDNLHELDIVTYDGERFRVGVNEERELDRIVAVGGRKGEIYARLRALRDKYADLIRARYRPVSELPRRVSGYNLDELLPERGFNVARALAGTEGTCVTVVGATLMLSPALRERVTAVIGFDDLCQAADLVPELMRFRPVGLEGMDHRLFRNEKLKGMDPNGLGKLSREGKHAWLMVQFGADTVGQANADAERLRAWLVQEGHVPASHIGIYDSKQAGGDTESIWQVREGGLGATSFPPGGDHWPGWEDSAVPPPVLGRYMRELRALYKKFGLEGAMYGHLGQGCVHSRISFDLRHADGIEQYRRFLDEASDLVVEFGGSLSGEHGDGQQRAEFLYKQYGPELVAAMGEFKAIWDPDGKMNPGKVVDPHRVDENLKLGTGYNPWRPDVKFGYPKDGGDFAHATLRCVGVGKCREPHGVDVMCPSYIVTRDEKHTTRGRARLLFEMLQGDVIRDGWQSEEVREALDLCLACKGCSSDCPVHVDMPTYKAEFLYHHFKSPKRFRSRSMYAFGFIDQAARVAAWVPELVNFVTQTPGLARLAKLASGMSAERSIPKFAPMTLQRWFAARPIVNPRGPRVIVWPDTFNNHFHTETGVACVEALEAGGYRVLMPRGHVCCGRPLYDYGFLDMAQRYLERTLGVLRDEIRRGTPVIGLEPSCLAVFRDELTNLLPHDDDAARLSRQAFHFAEFVAKAAEERRFELPELSRTKAVVWGHCHHKATGGMKPELSLLCERLHMDATEAKGGCCGLAGSFGFESGHYDISMQCAEVGFLPAVRRAERETFIVADGFSCRTQLEQAKVGREALHTGELLQLARRHSLAELRSDAPERLRGPRPAPGLAVRITRVAIPLAVSAAAVAWAAFRFRPRRGLRGWLASG